MLFVIVDAISVAEHHRYLRMFSWYQSGFLCVHQPEGTGNPDKYLPNRLPRAIKVSDGGNPQASGITEQSQTNRLSISVFRFESTTSFILTVPLQPHLPHTFATSIWRYRGSPSRIYRNPAGIYLDKRFSAVYAIHGPTPGRYS